MDDYKHSPEGISPTITSLKTVIDDYKDKIVELSNLVNTIEASSAWKDVSVKTAFISTANSYINLYKSLSSCMENYVSYLTSKSEAASALENAYAKG